ncbi:MAG: hypothetical protein SGBAC_003137 [Bacillariaceae sp.]
MANDYNFQACSKVYSATFFNPCGRSTACRLEQFPNAPGPIPSTVDGSLISRSAGYLVKVSAPISFKPEYSSACRNALQPAKAHSSITASEPGILIRCKTPQSEKAFFPMLFNPAGNPNPEKEEPLSNAKSPIVFTVEGISICGKPVQLRKSTSRDTLKVEGGLGANEYDDCRHQWEGLALLQRQRVCPFHSAPLLNR